MYNCLLFKIDEVRYIAQLVEREAEDFWLNISKWKLEYIVPDYESGAVERRCETFLDASTEAYPVYEILGMYLDLNDELQDLIRPHMVQKGCNIDDPYVIIRRK